jgi:hypothetical protein
LKEIRLETVKNLAQEAKLDRKMAGSLKTPCHFSKKAYLHFFAFFAFFTFFFATFFFAGFFLAFFFAMLVFPLKKNLVTILLYTINDKVKEKSFFYSKYLLFC